MGNKLKRNTKSSAKEIDLKSYSSDFSLRSKIARSTWNIFWFFLFRLSAPPFHGWRRLLLRLFGSRIESSVRIHPSVRIWAPWNLNMSEGSSLGPGVDCYSVDRIEIGPWAVVSQRTFLCTATHDIRSQKFRLKTAPIKIKEKSWVASEVFVGPGVTIGECSVVGARACVTKDVKPWSVVAGNPAKYISQRKISNR